MSTQPPLVVTDIAAAINLSVNSGDMTTIRRNDWFEIMEQICHREGVTVNLGAANWRFRSARLLRNSDLKK